MPPRRLGPLGSLLPGVAAFLAACPLALLIARINLLMPARPEHAVALVGACCALLISVPAVIYAIAKRRTVVPERLGLVVLLSFVVVLTGIDLYTLWTQIIFPADILIWSESDFVNDIIKLRVGYPLYTAQVNNDSSVYMPGAQLLTYGIAALFGHPTSVPVLRAIQLGYTVLAAVIGALAVRRVLQSSAPNLGLRNPRLWAAIWVPALFLVATNSITNPFIVNLHNDALAQLITVTAFWLLLEYAATRDRRVLTAMALLPAAGIFVKQSLAVWAVLYCVYLLIFDRPRSFARVLASGAGAFGGIAAIVGAGYLIWGRDFIYWTITVLGAHGVNPLRSIQHVLDAWTYFAVGLAAGLVLLRGPAFQKLFGPWSVWLTVFGLAAYTSGIAWMLNHLGPGSMIAGIWFLAAAALLWTDHMAAPAPLATDRWMRPALAVGVAVLLSSGLGVIRIPLPTFTPDATRYVREIEKEFEGLPPQDVLLDAGSWVYAKSGVVMKDRAPSIGDRGYSRTGDFSALLDRIAQQRYAKILVRNFHSPDFWYDHSLWAESSGIRQALEANYHEVGTIAAVRERDATHGRYLFNPISILIRNAR